MRLLVFSDVHGDRKALSRLLATEADYYVSAGDLVTWARGLDDMATLLKSASGRVYLLPGNHESAEMVASCCARFGFQDFHGKTIQVGTYTVAGLGYSSPTPFNTPGEYSEAELARRLKPFAALKKLVLICHAPPHNTPLDRVCLGFHAGSTAIAEFLAKHQPEWFLCGHIHEAEGVETRLGRTRAVNVGKRGYLLELD